MQVMGSNETPVFLPKQADSGAAVAIESASVNGRLLS
jgi:hypothetical protein